MKSDIIKFFALQRQIFSTCPKCNNLFRLSECKVYLKKKPVPDWMDKIDTEQQRLVRLEEKLEEKEEGLREKAREIGRREAQKAVKKVDKVFSPRRLNPDDAKVIFHPIDYIVFNGMKGAESIKNIVLLDRELKKSDQRTVQRSIERVVERENYEWQTLRVKEDGKIKVE